MPDRIHMLTHLSTLEVSNVRLAANRKRYAITKSEETETMKIAQAVLSTPAEGEAEYVATLKSAGADEKRIEAATAAYRIRKGFADVLRPEDLGVTVKGHAEPDGDEQGDEESDEAYKARKAKKCANTAKSAAVANVVTGMTPEANAKLEAVMKSNQTLAAQVQTLADANLELEYVAKAQREFSHVPEVGGLTVVQVLKNAHAAGPETEKAMLATLKSINDLVAKSPALQELGTSGGGTGASADADAKLQALAKSVTMKSENGKEMTDAQKYTYVVTKTAEGRTLYAQYLEQHPRQRA